MFSANFRFIDQITSLIFFSALSFTAVSQDVKINQARWQQEVDYTIQVQLDDINHLLTGKIAINYVNNSPDTLTYVMMHLWPNAYKNDNTAFAQQMLGNGKTEFYFAKDSERGWIDSLNFTVNGAEISWELDDEHIDIARLELGNYLLPGDSVVIESPFKVKIPGSFSRFGHIKNGYQITQWYPKPAVYDVNGWNAMPYLEQGEFYSEFGSFDVQITLPADYVVSATGELQEEEEWEFLRNREGQPMSEQDQKEKRNGKTSSSLKTIAFKQDNVHDFAWFADPTFNVTTNMLQLPSGDTVMMMVFTTERYDRQKCAEYISYIEQTLLYYSQYVGNYPYAYCSVVQGALVAGSGMEYPMVTVIPNLGREVVVHEVRHNWFYGILGSNERTYPWMDESINSYYDKRTRMNSGNNEVEESDPLGDIKVKEAIKDEGTLNELVLGVMVVDAERKYEHQPVAASSEEFTWSNYVVMVYGKGARSFEWLAAYLEHNTMDEAVQTYFDRWKFCHPLPGDIKTVFEEVSGKDLSWFFDDYLKSDGVLDYSLDFVNKDSGKATIRNRGDIVAPFPIDYIQDNKIIQTVWVEGFAGEKEVELLNIEYTALKIDARQLMGETYTRNNTYRLNSVFHKIEKLKRNWFFSLEDPNRTQLAVIPVLGWNTYDNFMVGLGFSNIRLPRQPFEFVFTPMYGFGSGQITGYGDVRYTKYYKQKVLSSSQLGIKLARFTQELPGIYRDSFTYLRLSPFIKFQFAKPYERSQKERSLTLQATWIDFTPSVDDEQKLAGIEAMDTSRRSSFVTPDPRTFFRIRYESANKRAVNPYSFRLGVETGMVSNTTTWLDSSKTTDDERFTKVDLLINYRVSYPFHDKGLDIRFFAGGFVEAPEASAYQFAYNNTSNEVAHPDYQNEYALMGRGMRNGLFANQLIDDGPFLKNVGMIFLADQWIAAVNLESGLPFKWPVGVYMDLFTSNNIEEISTNKDLNRIGYSGGIHLNFLKGSVKIYAPLFASKFITEAQEFRNVDRFTERITFTLNLNMYNPFNLREALSNVI